MYNSTTKHRMMRVPGTPKDKAACREQGAEPRRLLGCEAARQG